MERVRFLTARRGDPRAAYEVEVDEMNITITAYRWNRYGHHDEVGKLRYGFGSPSEAQHVANLLTRDLPKLIANMFGTKEV